MSSAIQLGPLLLPSTLLLVFASIASTLALGKWLSKSSTEVDRALWHWLNVCGLRQTHARFIMEFASVEENSRRLTIGGLAAAAQDLGFSLNEVAGLLKLKDGTHCREARERGIIESFMSAPATPAHAVRSSTQPYARTTQSNGAPQ